MPRPPLPPAEPMKLDALAEIARGGMGSVELVRVLDGRLAGQLLAVKWLHPNIAEDPEFVSMFLDEAWITAALKHPNVAQVIAWGNEAEKGPYLAIELVQGVSLSRLLKEAQTNQEPFAERTVAFICSQICAGLTAAHSLTAPDGTPLGVVHRDLTPANVLVSFDGAVKIIDFGIAKAEERITHTRTGQLKGKPSYMAPEQQRGKDVDHRADIFAFGVTMFELLAGRRPWTAKGAFEVMMEIASDPHPDLGELRRGLNPEFVAIAHKCLEKKPEARFNSAAEIKARLDAWLAAKGFAADDQQSLAQFVQRNSQPQIKWWQEALRGEHASAKKKGPTFKELEEKIDEEREKLARASSRAARPQPPKPASPTLGGTKPMQPIPVKMGGDPPYPPAQPVGSVSPASQRQPPVSQPPAALGGTVAMSAFPVPPASGRMSASGDAPVTPVPMSPAHGPSSSGPPPASQARPPVSLAGTEFMAVSPFSTATPVPGSMPPSVPPTLASAAMPRPDAQPPSRPSVPQPSLPPHAQPAVAPPPVGAGTETGTQPMAAVPYGALQTSAGTRAPPAPAAPVKRSRVGLVIALVTIPILGAAAAGAWFFRDELSNLGGSGGNTRAPAAKPSGKSR